MTDIEPDFNYCSDCEDGGEGVPAIQPPCTVDTCSTIALPLDETGGKLGFITRLRGSKGAAFIKRLKAGCDDPEDCGVLRCFVDADGNNQGLDVDLFGDPPLLTGVDCVDGDGESLYVNPLRRFKNVDGSCSLGVLPFPIQDLVCVEGGGCDGLYPVGSAGDVFEGCGPSICVNVVNVSCYPMIVVPKMTIEGAELGNAPVTYEVQPNINGSFQSKIPIVSGAGFACDMGNAGTGATTVDGDGDTAAGGADNHVHGITEHSHDGPSHSHSLDCSGTGRSTYSGTTEFAPVEVAPGDDFTFCIDASMRYDGDVEEPGQLNYGTLRVCLDYRSKVTPETIAQLEGSE